MITDKEELEDFKLHLKEGNLTGYPCHVCAKIMAYVNSPLGYAMDSSTSMCVCPECFEKYGTK